MNLRCKLGQHDRRASCACARCGEPAPDDKFLDITFGKDERPSDTEIERWTRARLARHQWNGCTCTRCGMVHAWVLVQEEQIDQRTSVVFLGGEGKGLYRRSYVCAICGEPRVEEKWEQNQIG
jgi:hypothetical protein